MACSSGPGSGRAVKSELSTDRAAPSSSILLAMSHASSHAVRPDADLPRLLTAEEVAAVLGVDPRTVQRFASDGRLPRVVLGRRSTRYRDSDVRALIDHCLQNDDSTATRGAVERKVR